jgi:plastocyanin
MTRMGRMAAIGVLLTLLTTLAGSTTATAGGGGHCTRDEGDGARVEMAGACFTPSTLFADAGERITFVNTDTFAHNVTGSGWGNLEAMAERDRFSYAFKVDGVYPFACTLHPGMNGAIVVGTSAATSALTAGDAGPVAVVGRSSSDDATRWVAAGAAGLLVGAVAGVALDRARKRRTA